MASYSGDISWLNIARQNGPEKHYLCDAKVLAPSLLGICGPDIFPEYSSPPAQLHNEQNKYTWPSNAIKELSQLLTKLAFKLYMLKLPSTFCSHQLINPYFTERLLEL